MLITGIDRPSVAGFIDAGDEIGILETRLEIVFQTSPIGEVLRAVASRPVTPTRRSDAKRNPR
ncbi:hypothetical protein SAMN04489841_2988 [Natrinema salaciae]|uniref:Uncharacterized protein n=2 Tax=Natrinema salaciae TaxID=1186196 RepID=A0A1H9LJI8_9EURY|nr:hypothetical protein SAMN04489841_2988 [Natrinema salaciae]